MSVWMYSTSLRLRRSKPMARLLSTTFDLQRCPHCNVDRPSLTFWNQIETTNFDNTKKRIWRFYQCRRCGGFVTAAAPGADQEATEIYPSSVDTDPAIPERARSYLSQALNSLSSPAGAVMLAASSVDAMLKAKNLKEGSLYARIDKAAA